MINCSNIKEHLNRYLDKEPDAATDSAVKEHLSKCPSCRAWFDKEARLEKNLVKILAQTSGNDAEIWAKAIDSLGDSGLKKRLLNYFVPIASAALIMITLGMLLLFPPASSSLDLLEAAEQIHQSVLRPNFRLDLKTDSPETLNKYFNAQYKGETPDCNTYTTCKKDCSLRGGRMCTLKQRQAMHIVIDYNSIPVSILVLPKDDLNAFPEAEARLEKCYEIYTAKSKGFNYALVRIGPNIVCAIGEVEQEILKQLLIDMGATDKKCNKCLKQQ
ncbi:MAG: zf-HC2 domain-containing protein [Planctomycetes bacterium]|nr:zf-HC2 domain-containing protein [Planctomycetota bacterium]